MLKVEPVTDFPDRFDFYGTAFQRHCIAELGRIPFKFLGIFEEMSPPFRFVIIVR